MALLGGLSDPLRRLDRIARDAAPVAQHDAEAVLGVLLALLRRAPEPLGGFRLVLGNAQTLLVHGGEIVLGGRIPPFGGDPVPPHRHRVVPGDARSRAVAIAEPVGRHGISGGIRRAGLLVRDGLAVGADHDHGNILVVIVLAAPAAGGGGRREGNRREQQNGKGDSVHGTPGNVSRNRHGSRASFICARPGTLDGVGVAGHRFSCPSCKACAGETQEPSRRAARPAGLAGGGRVSLNEEETTRRDPASGKGEQ